MDIRLELPLFFRCIYSDRINVRVLSSGEHNIGFRYAAPAAIRWRAAPNDGPSDTGRGFRSALAQLRDAAAQCGDQRRAVR
jgi:hypothetical protein